MGIYIRNSSLYARTHQRRRVFLFASGPSELKIKLLFGLTPRLSLEHAPRETAERPARTPARITVR